MLYVAILFAVIILCFGIDVFCHRHPLTADEVVLLAEKWRRNRALSEYQFSTYQQIADAAEKKAMKGMGEFLVCDLAYTDTPARIAGLLKYKKHEWIVIAFVRGRRVTHLWWNKGPDGTTVWSFLRDNALDRTLESVKPDILAIFHNHPNPDPSRYRMNIPSNADLTSAGFLHRDLGKRNISLLEFICERGVPHLYYAAFSDDVIPIGTILAEVNSINGKNVFKNYSLRKNLKSRTPAEQIYGGLNPAPK
jgi:hypothetical protein